MAGFNKLIFLFNKNKKNSGRSHTDSAPPDSIGTCLRHPQRQAAGICKYCERVLCPDCLTIKNGYLCCVDKADCLQHLEQPEISKAEQVRKMLKEFSERPNAQIIDEVIKLVHDSKEPEITDAIHETFTFECSNLGVYGLAIHCLGLVRDTRALRLLVQCFDTLSNQESLPPDPRLRAICADHLQRSAHALLNMLSKRIYHNSESIRYVEKILESPAIPWEIKKRANWIL